MARNSGLFSVLSALLLVGGTKAFLHPFPAARSPLKLVSSTQQFRRLEPAGFYTARVDPTDIQLGGNVTATGITDNVANNSTLETTTDQESLPQPQQPVYPPTPTLREILAFTLPALGIYTCPPLMSLIDTSFVGRLSSSVELAALGPASSISDSAPLPLLFLSIAATNLVAKSFAQKDEAALSRISRTALSLGTVGGILMAVVLYAKANPISLLYCGGPGAADLLASSCTKYVAIRALALPFVVMTTIAQAICIGTKDTRTPMLAVALAGGLNLIGDFILVGWFKQGIAGAAWATAGSQVLAAGLLLRVLKKRGFLEPPQSASSSVESHQQEEGRFQTVKQLFAFIPFLFVMSVKIGWHNSCAATAASLGGAQAAAHTALVSVGMLCFIFGDVGSSLSQAFLPAFMQTAPSTTKQSSSSSLTSDSNEEKSITTAATTTPSNEKPSFNLDAAMPTIKQLLKCTLGISTTVVLMCSIIIGLFGGQITKDAAVLAEMKKTLPWIATALSLHGTAVSLEGILLSQKKLKGLTIFYTFLAATIVAWQVMVRQWGLGLAGVWGCYIWVSGSRVITFSLLGGLIRPRQWFRNLREKGMAASRRLKARTA